MERSYPAAARQVLQNLVSMAEQAVSNEFQGKLRSQDLDQAWAQFSRLNYAWASTELSDRQPRREMPLYDSGGEEVDVTSEQPQRRQRQAPVQRRRRRLCWGRAGQGKVGAEGHASRTLAHCVQACLYAFLAGPSPGGLPMMRTRTPRSASAAQCQHSPLTLRPALPTLTPALSATRACAGWSARQQQVAGNLLRIRAVVRAYVERVESERTTEFLYAATLGSEVKVRQVHHVGGARGKKEGTWSAWAGLCGDRRMHGKGRCLVPPARFVCALTLRPAAPAPASSW